MARELNTRQIEPDIVVRVAHFIRFGITRVDARGLKRSLRLTKTIHGVGGPCTGALGLI